MKNQLCIAGQLNSLQQDGRLLRVLSVVPAAAVVTLVLVLGMERLIRVDPNLEAPIDTGYAVPSPVLVPRDPPPVVRERLERPKPIEEAPDLPDFNPDIDVSVSDAPPTVGGVRENIGEVNITAYSGNTPIPTVIVQPNYPIRAANKGIEGYVDVQFDVTRIGATDNISIIQSEPVRIFDKAAIKAVSRWRYSPVIVDGKAERFSGMSQRLVFEMERG